MCARPASCAASAAAESVPSAVPLPALTAATGGMDAAEREVAFDDARTAVVLLEGVDRSNWRAAAQGPSSLPSPLPGCEWCTSDALGTLFNMLDRSRDELETTLRYWCRTYRVDEEMRMAILRPLDVADVEVRRVLDEALRGVAPPPPSPLPSAWVVPDDR